MKHRDGGKYKKKCIAFTDLGARVASIVDKLNEVSSISAGHTQNGKIMTGGTPRVKISDIQGGILLTARQSCSVQEIKLYGSDLQATRLAVARALRDNGILIAFRHE